MEARGEFIRKIQWRPEENKDVCKKCGTKNF